MLHSNLYDDLEALPSDYFLSKDVAKRKNSYLQIVFVAEKVPVFVLKGFLTDSP